MYPKITQAQPRVRWARPAENTITRITQTLFFKKSVPSWDGFGKMKNRLIKVITWRVISILITFCVLAVATGNIRSATSITLFLHCLLTVCHLGFETFWEGNNEDR